MPSPRRFGLPPHLRRVAALVAVALGVLAAGCTGDDAATDATTGTTVVPADESSPADDPLAVSAYADPAAPIVAAVGERFALLLDAEPTEGYRWEVASQGDPAVVLPLGSQFVDRDSVEATPTTTTTTTVVVPPEPDPAAVPAEEAGGEPSESTVDGEVPLTVAPDPPPDPVPTTTTVPTRSRQVLSYVARGAGRTTITVRYIRVGAAADTSTPTLTFTVEVPTPPPLF